MINRVVLDKARKWKKGKQTLEELITAEYGPKGNPIRDKFDEDLVEQLKNKPLSTDSIDLLNKLQRKNHKK